MDKKLTDAEIVKALECCCKGQLYQCNNCPLKINGYSHCFDTLRKYTLDLINRIQAEKEALIAGQETLQKYIAEQKAENERLKNRDMQVEVSKKLETEIKAEAYKECIEEVKKELSLIRLGCRNLLDNEGVFAIDLARKQVDNILKELGGEDK